jgi:hypothetical protein
MEFVRSVEINHDVGHAGSVPHSNLARASRFVVEDYSHESSGEESLDEQV